MAGIAWLNPNSSWRNSTGKNPADSSGVLNAWGYPESWEDWVSRYTRLFDAYVGNPYNIGAGEALQLFRAVDDNGEIIAETTRLTRDVQHVVDTDALALVGGGLTLEADDGSAAMLALGEEVWNRSSIDERIGGWFRQAASMGDLCLEGTWDSAQQGRVVRYDPREVLAVYDTETDDLLEATIVIDYYDPREVGADGIVDTNPILHKYVRRLKPDEIVVYVDGEEQDEGSGTHTLGVCPLVHAPYLPYTDPAHGMWAAQGLEPALGYLDSMTTMVQAIANRYAAPKGYIKGAKLGDTSDIALFGRWISGMPPDAEIGYLEPDLKGVGAVLDAMRMHREQVRETLPEFLFSGAAADASGEALKTRASAFAMKLNEIRSRYYRALARAAWFAALRQDGGTYDPTETVLKVEGGPVLPVDVPAETEMLGKVKRDGGLTHADYIRHLQRLGVVGNDVVPEKYATEVEDQQAARAAAFFTPDGGQGNQQPSNQNPNQPKG